MRTISDHVMDIVQNSVRAGATQIEIIVEENLKNDLYILNINDNGCGMSSEMLEQAVSPFFTSRNTRKVGLGIPLLKQKAETAGGNFEIDSEEGRGTFVKAVFRHRHIDRPPLGDIWNTWLLTVLGNPELRIVYRHITGKGEFEADSRRITEMFEGASLQQKEIREAIMEWMENNIKDIETDN